jgi:Spy/CpxP family protein refolding chaperone
MSHLRSYDKTIAAGSECLSQGQPQGRHRGQGARQGEMEEGGRWIGVILWGTAVIALQAIPGWGDESYRNHGTPVGHHQREHRSGRMFYGMEGYFTGAGPYLQHLLTHQDAIGLTDEQVQRLKTIQLDLDKTRIRTEAEIMVAERELRALIEDEKVDLSAIEAKLKQREGLATALRMAGIKAKRDAVGTLNQDQRKKERFEHEKMMFDHRGASGRNTHEKPVDRHR